MTSEQLARPDESRPVNLDNISPEVADAIAVCIRTWDKLGRTDHLEDQREKARRARDTTLLNASLTSKQGFDLFYPTLIRNAQVPSFRITGIFRLIKRKPEYAIYIKAFVSVPNKLAQRTPHIMQRDGENLMKTAKELLPKDQQSGDVNTTQNKMVDYVLRRTNNLETLILRDGSVHFPLVENVGGKSRPVHYISNSLKRIHTTMSRSYPISGRMVIWIMSFCPTLHEASFNFTITEKDFKFLDLHCQGFKGKSNVKKLAIAPTFPQKTNYWVPKDMKDRKLIAVSSLLQVTKELTSLEVWGPDLPHMAQGVYDAFLPYDCLKSVESSFSTLKSLRVNGCGPNTTGPENVDLSNFKNLEFLCYDSALHLKSLPSSLKVLQLYSYVLPPPPYPFVEEEILLKLLQDEKKRPKGLELVIVPAAATDRYLVQAKSDTNTWRRQREELKRAKIFKDGKVKLKVLKEDVSSES